MRKMPCLFVRNFHGRNLADITREVTPGCEWVLVGEGEASIKRDGTACAVFDRDGEPVLFARYDAKAGKAPPDGAIPCDDEPNPVTGHWPHWVEVKDQPHLKWHREAWATYVDGYPITGPGTYELCGPKLQGNPEGLAAHVFIRHGAEVVPDAPRDFDGLRAFLESWPHEGLVFAHRDGRRCKIRRADFGFAWPLGKAVAA